MKLLHQCGDIPAVVMTWYSRYLPEKLSQPVRVVRPRPSDIDQKFVLHFETERYEWRYSWGKGWACRAKVKGTSEWKEVCSGREDYEDKHVRRK